MFRNLKAELARAGMTTNDYAKELNISQKSVTNKYNGEREFKLNEMIVTKKLFPDCSLDYLFEKMD